MKKLIIVCAFAIILTGCNPERERICSENHKLSKAFDHRMKQGKTTREQEQMYVTKSTQMFKAMDESVRGKTKSDQTEFEMNAMLGEFVTPTIPEVPTKP